MTSVDATAPPTAPAGYRALTPESVGEYLAGVPAAAAVLGGGGPADWRAREVGDGNLNLVFIVEGPARGLVVKQALPYVWLVGESWPLPRERSGFEHAHRLHHGHAGGHPGHRPGVRLLRADGLRRGRAGGQPVPGLLRPGRPRTRAGRAGRLP